MKVNFGIIFFISAFFQFAAAQTTSSIDSLKLMAERQPPAQQMKTFNKIADLLLYSNIKESFGYSKKSFNIAKELNDTKGLEDACINFGWYYLQSEKPDSAKYFLLKAIQFGKATKNDHSRLNAMAALANALSELMMYDSAIIVLNDARITAEKNNAVAHLANIYAVLGNVYSMIGQPDTAVALYFRAKNYYAEEGNKNDLAVMLNNIATIFTKSEKYKEALDLLEEAAGINRANNNVAALMMNISNAAICYKETGRPEKAISELHKNIVLAKKHNLSAQLAVNYNTMGNTLVNMNRIQQARMYFDSSLLICDKEDIGYGLLVNNIDLGFMFSIDGQNDSAILYYMDALARIKQYDLKHEESKILLGLYRSYKNMEAYDSALIYFEGYKTLEDTLHKVDINQKLAELEGKYRQEKNLKTIAELNENIYRQRAGFRLIIIVVLTLFSAAFIYLMYKRYKNRNRLLMAKVIEKEKEKLETLSESQQKELAVKAMHMARLNEISFEVSQKLSEISYMVSAAAKEKIRALITSLDMASPDQAWKEFETRFENVHEDFYRVLKELHPELTPTEIKVCSLIRLNMTTKDIATLTNRSIRTIESTRSSIRKKLHLGNETSLSGYLLSI